jgi:23S rRNA pseudouridine1911/1915/1917 synthase
MFIGHPLVSLVTSFYIPRMNYARKLDRILAKFDCAIPFEDDALIAISKSSGLLVIPDRYNHAAPCLSDFLKDEFGSIFVVHRLDRETSGVVVFAKTAEAHQQLNEEFENRKVEKQYLAIVRGIPAQETGIINLPIGEHRHTTGRMTVDFRRGKDSATEYTVLERFDGYAFIDVRPKTGRTHQIRVHLQEIGLPIVCDPFYGDGSPFLLSSIKRGYRVKGDEERPLLARTALHAAMLVIQHPVTNEKIEISSEMPKDMQAVLKSMRKYAGVRPLGSQLKLD